MDDRADHCLVGNYLHTVAVAVSRRTPVLTDIDDMATNTPNCAVEELLLALSTCPPDQAEDIAATLVREKHAACINVLPQVKSFYRWQGELESTGEALLVIKCRADSYQGLQQRLLEIHPYELPELITVPLAGGLEPYLAWVSDPEH
jgi:periplasmic divalent cation tolerance protein